MNSWSSGAHDPETGCGSMLILALAAVVVLIVIGLLLTRFG